LANQPRIEQCHRPAFSHAVVFFQGLWLATNLLHVFSSGKSFLADLALKFLGEIPSAKLRF